MPNYWLLDPAARTLECFRLEDAGYRLDASGKERGSVDVPAFAGLAITLDILWLDRG